jgi:hypothetical protein
MTKFADIHCHTGLHPFAFNLAGKKKNNSVWDHDPPLDRQSKSKYPEYTQSDFCSLARGGVKLIYISIYPIEQGWFDASIIGTGLVTDTAAKIISRVPAKFINMVQDQKYKYFDFFSREYDYLHKEEGLVRKVDGKNFKYVMIGPGDDIDVVLSEDGTIGVIITVEGAQSFIAGNEKDIVKGSFSLVDTLHNIETVKKWRHPPFFVSMSHHFFNGFCGHTRSLPAPASVLLKQAIGLNEPINDWGKKVIDCFLGINEFEGNGPRILIDTKHMSVASRLEYYARIRAFNAGRNDPEKIPVVVSHTAYSKHPTMTAAIMPPDTFAEKYNASEKFNNWSINLSDDEVFEVFNSNGIIGLNFDERILAGNKVLQDYRNKFSIKDLKKRLPEIRKFWTQQIIDNLLGIVRVVVNSGNVAAHDKVKIWNNLAIGTDFDGMINPEDGFITAGEFPAFREMMEELLPVQDDIGHLLQGLPIEKAIDKIMFENALDFARMYYKNA